MLLDIWWKKFIRIFCAIRSAPGMQSFKATTPCLSVAYLISFLDGLDQPTTVHLCKVRRNRRLSSNRAVQNKARHTVSS